MGLLDNLSSVINTASEVLKSDAAKQVIGAVTGSSNGGSFDIATGLKEALNLGIKVAAENLSKENGYLSDMAVRIGLPSEAVTAFSTVQSLANNGTFNSILNATGVTIPDTDTVITLFNRAAENAAPKSVDVFVNAITNMSIDDAKAILFGEDNAATTYLKNTTMTGLQNAFNPSITESLSTVKIGSFTPLAAWETFSTYNNKLVELLDSRTVKSALELARMTGIIKNDQFESLLGAKEVDKNLPGFITGKALDGLFLKVSEKESDIRHNATARVSDVLQSVFGQLDKR